MVEVEYLNPMNTSKSFVLYFIDIIEFLYKQLSLDFHEN